ncbi:hypothetical protein ABMA28_016550 [Loxostege sticticalis]|uniref:C2H2-type domain-containing protein n=1 Tax=Loxostege sticticalis TaxID=481309 RepID=A0ABD0T9I1_LOXSC
MRNVDSHLLDGKMDETVTHYITSHQQGEPVHVDSNGLPLNVQDDGGGRVVTVMHPQSFPSHLCRQVSVSEPVAEGQWGEELLDTDTRLAALVAHLHHPPPHHKHTTVQSSRGDVDTSVILDAPMRLFNGQSLDQQEDIVVEVPQLPPLPPLQEMKMRNQEADWFNNKTKTILKDDTPMLTDSDGPVLELGASASPAQNKQQNKKSLPHKKRISRKLKRNNGSSTPQQQLVVINCSEDVQQEEILPDNFVASVQHQQHIPETHHITHEVRPIFICQICGDFYGDEQLKFYHHLKQHYEPHTIIIENPVPDLGIDKMTNTCIVDNVGTLPDSIMELSQSLENTVPKTMYQPMDKHILYTSSDKTLSYSSNKMQYTMASMDKDPAVPTSEAEKTDLYETLEKLEFFSCVKCNKSFRKLKQCEAHIREAHNTKLEDINEFSEPEDLMEGIHVAVDEAGEHYEHTLLPHLTVENGHVHQDHIRHWYMRNGNSSSPPPEAAAGSGGGACYCPVCPAPDPAPHADPAPHDHHQLKEEVLQRIFETEVSNPEPSFSENILPDSSELPEPPAAPPPAAQPPKQDGKKKAQKKFECTQCGRVFLHRNSLMYHLLSHSGKQQVCRECGKSFYTAAALKIHKRVHSDLRPCKCEECGREFRQWSDLKYHKSSIHSNQKHFKCEFCGKEFARKYSLNLHRRIHTGERNYKCEYCNKSFRASSYRLSHMRTHTGDRPYKCNECDKCFRVAGDLRRHTLTHDKSRARQEEKAKNKQTDKKLIKKEPDMNIKIENIESIANQAKPDAKNYKKIAVASTTRLPNILKVDKKAKLKKSPVAKKGGAPNVTVTRNDSFKIAENSDIEVFELRNLDHYKYKEMYSEPTNVKDYSEIYKDSERIDERDMFRNNLCDVVEKPTYRTENTDGKLQIFTHIEKTKDYSGPVISNPVSLGDIRHLERELAREVRSDTLHGENIENGFIDRLTALYNIPAV